MPGHVVVTIVFGWSRTIIKRRVIMSTATITATPARTFTIDQSHSEVAFQVRHLLSRVRGRFSEFAGTITFDPARPEAASVNVQIQSASIDTSEPKRDAHLKSDDFFAAATFPTLSFLSTGVVSKGKNQFAVEGDLTIRDITRRIVLPVSFLGSARDPWGNEKVAFEAEITINRKEYGLNWNAALETGGFLVGDDVKVSLAIQAA
jgi:polyisoprenoid-binding protein YceI